MKLKPCPFCGSTDIELSINRTTYPFWYISTYCKKCNCYGEITIVNSENTKQIAINAWNTRTPTEKGGSEE